MVLRYSPNPGNTWIQRLVTYDWRGSGLAALVPRALKADGADGPP